jgi:hypothetical protein
MHVFVMTLRQIRLLGGAKVQKEQNTYNSGYSLVVTHLTTNPPVRCLNGAERTGSLVFSWSVVIKVVNMAVCSNIETERGNRDQRINDTAEAQI